MKKTKLTRELFACPHCGADVVVGSRVCRECGSDASTGWQDEAEIESTSVDLPDGYRDPDRPHDRLPSSKPPTWVVVTALVTAAVMIALVLGVFAFR